MDLKQTYNKIAEDWHKDHQQDDWWVKGTNRFIQLIGKGGTVLDVGCGAGFKSKYLIKKGLKIYGIDFSDRMIELAKKEVPREKFLVMDMEKIKLDEKFDGVFAQACLLHAPKKKAPEIIKKWVDLLKAKGYIYIAVKESNKGIDEEIVKENDYGYEYERFFSYYTQEEVEKYIKDAGLEVVYSTITFSGHTNWIQTIGKK